MFTVYRRTMSKRKRAKLKAIKTELRKRIHQRLTEVGKLLGRWSKDTIDITVSLRTCLVVLVSLSRCPSLVSHASASQPEDEADLGADVPFG